MTRCSTTQDCGSLYKPTFSISILHFILGSKINPLIFLHSVSIYNKTTGCKFSYSTGRPADSSGRSGVSGDSGPVDFHAPTDALVEGNDVIPLQQSITCTIRAGQSTRRQTTKGNGWKSILGNDVAYFQSIGHFPQTGRYRQPQKLCGVLRTWIHGPKTGFSCLSTKGSKRRRCRICKIRTKWNCPCCYNCVLCPGECFLEYHSKFSSKSKLSYGYGWRECQILLK